MFFLFNVQDPRPAISGSYDGMKGSLEGSHSIKLCKYCLFCPQQGMYVERCQETHVAGQQKQRLGHSLLTYFFLLRIKTAINLKGNV